MKQTLFTIAMTTMLIGGICIESYGSDKKATSPECAYVAPPTVPSAFIKIDSANKMLNSYLNSINYESNDTDLRSLSVDADQLRTYLANTSITSVKLMLGHTLQYINHGGQNTPCGYKSNALTIIIACYDVDGNYIYNTPVQNPSVLDYCAPCPTNCPTSGSAASDTLPN